MRCRRWRRCGGASGVVYWVGDRAPVDALLESAGCCAEPGVRPERPLVDRVHTVPTQAWKRNAFSVETVRGIGRLRRELRAERFDLCVDMQGLIRSSLVGAVAGRDDLWAGASRGRRRRGGSMASGWRCTAAHVIEQGCELLGGAVGEALQPGG